MDIATLQDRLAPIFPGLMGVRLTELSDQRVVAEMTVRPDLCTAGGILHGGAFMAFADTLGAVGTMVWQTTIRNADGKLCAVVTQTQLVLDAA